MVVVEFREGAQGRVVLDPADAGATVVVGAMEGETGSAAFIIECIPTVSESGCSSWS